MRSFLTSSANERSAIVDPWVRHERQRSNGTSGAVLDLKGRAKNNRSRRRQEIEVGQALQPVSARAVHEVMTGIRRLQVVALPGIRADRLGAKAGDIPLVDEKLNDIGRGSSRVVTGLLG